MKQMRPFSVRPTTIIVFGVGSVQHELMICGIYINSFNVDEGVLVKIKPPIN